MEIGFDKRLMKMKWIHPRHYGELGIFSRNIPACGGVIKETPEDFRVDETPSYEACGEGGHLFLQVEKRGLSSDELTQELSRQLNIPERDIGFAGKKDKQAITRQFVSVPKAVINRLDHFEHPEIRIFSVKAHTNKLSVGHLKANRFTVKLRHMINSDPDVVKQIMKRIGDFGFPNFFGPQRFGAKGDTAEIGFKIINGDLKGVPKRWLNRSRKKFALSAAQSHLFNRYLIKRLIETGHQTLLHGDVVFKKTGGIFRVVDLETETKRFHQNEIVPAGPLYGKKTFPADCDALCLENEILREAGLERARFSEFGKLMLGARRALFIHPENFDYEIDGDSMTLFFTLPAGSYATVLLAEFIQPAYPYLSIPSS